MAVIIHPDDIQIIGPTEDTRRDSARDVAQRLAKAINDLGSAVSDLQGGMAALADQIASQQREIDRLRQIIIGTYDGGVTIRAATKLSLNGADAQIDLGETIATRARTLELYANIVFTYPLSGKSSQTWNFMAMQTTVKFGSCYLRSDIGMDLESLGPLKIGSAAELFLASSSTRIDAARIRVNCAISDFFRGNVRADTVIANSMVAASYTPGAGNIW